MRKDSQMSLRAFELDEQALDNVSGGFGLFPFVDVDVDLDVDFDWRTLKTDVNFSVDVNLVTLKDLRDRFCSKGGSIG
jgi:hypothetical protein